MTTLKRGGNRLIRLGLRAGLPPRGFALLETTDRRSGLKRHTPVGNGLDGDAFWLVAAHGTQADYVRNLQASPRVRVKVGGAWHAGTAVVLPGDDAVAGSRTEMTTSLHRGGKRVSLNDEPARRNDNLAEPLELL
jgi:deazaflavin-dependent oxidoreductase (nitroreductase family)